MFSLLKLSLPSSSLDGSVGIEAAVLFHCGRERTPHWSLWLNGWSALASGMVVTEMEIVLSPLAVYLWLLRSSPLWALCPFPVTLELS